MRTKKVKLALWASLVSVAVGTLTTHHLALATVACDPDPIIYYHDWVKLAKLDIRTGASELITANTTRTYFDIGIAPDGTLYGVQDGDGFLFEINKTTGVGTLVGEVQLPPGTNFNMLAFDQYGKGWFVAETGIPDVTQLMSFDPTAVDGSGNITPTSVIADLQSLGVPRGSSSGDVFFVGGNMYIAWASYEDPPQDGVRLIRIDMTNTGTAYTSAGTAADLGRINADGVYGMAALNGYIYVSNGETISRMRSLPLSADVNRIIEVIDVGTGDVGYIYGMTAEGEATVDNCLSVESFVAPPEPAVFAATERKPETSDPEMVAPSIPNTKNPKRLPETGSDGALVVFFGLISACFGVVLVRRSRTSRAS